MNSDYIFAPLDHKDIEALQQLESELQAEAGEEITLIAFSKKKDAPECRAD